jgi:hypothetical protein
MKKVLAELHELINELEDNGLTAEASSLQEVFVRVAQEADVKDDLANDVENVLKSHTAAEVLAEIAKQMAGGDDIKTMSFAYDDETELNSNGNKLVPYPKQTPEHREKVLKDFREKMDEMNKYYDKNLPWTTAPMPSSSLSSENFYEKKR